MSKKISFFAFFLIVVLKLFSMDIYGSIKIKLGYNPLNEDYIFYENKLNSTANVLGEIIAEGNEYNNLAGWFISVTFNQDLFAKAGTFDRSEQMKLSSLNINQAYVSLFPCDRIFFYVGLMNKRLGSGVLFVPTDLIYYRSNNVTDISIKPRGIAEADLLISSQFSLDSLIVFDDKTSFDAPTLVELLRFQEGFFTMEGIYYRLEASSYAAGYNLGLQINKINLYSEGLYQSSYDRLEVQDNSLKDFDGAVFRLSFGLHYKESIFDLRIEYLFNNKSLWDNINEQSWYVSNLKEIWGISHENALTSFSSSYKVFSSYKHNLFMGIALKKFVKLPVSLNGSVLLSGDFSFEDWSKSLSGLIMLNAGYSLNDNLFLYTGFSKSFGGSSGEFNFTNPYLFSLSLGLELLF